MKKQSLSRLISGTLALSLAWLVACAPQPGAVPPLQTHNPNTSAPAHASAALLRQGRPQHPNPNHPSNRRALQQRQPMPAYFVELNAEYQGFSTLALTASYLERKIRTLIANNNGEGLRREIDFARYKHPQLLIDIMLADPTLYATAAAMPEVISFRQQNAAFDMYMRQLAGEDLSPQEFRVNTSLGYHSNKSVAMNVQGQSVVVWDATHWGAQEQHIYAQRFNSQGLPDGPELQISTQTDQYHQMGWRSTSVAMDNSGDFVVTWTSYNSSWSERNVYARRYNSQGQALGAEFQVNTEAVAHSKTPSIAMDATGNFVIGWQVHNSDWSESHVYARRYNSQGQALGPEFQVNDPATEGPVSEPNLVMDADGDFWVSWTHYSHDWSESDILMRRYASNGEAQGATFQVNSLPEKNNLYYPMAAVDSQGNLVVSWTSYSEDWDDGEVFARRYGSNGTPQGTEFQVNSHAEGVQTTVAVAMAADGDFVVAWTGYDEDWNNPDVYARRYASNGSPQGPEFRINTSTGYYHAYPMLAMDGEGNFKIAWTRYEEGWSGLPSDIYAMRYNAAGEPQPALNPLPEHDVKPEFRVNTHSMNSQSEPDIARDADGNFVVVWHSSVHQNQDGDGAGIYAQRYDANGTPQGTEFQVNTYTTNHQLSPAVAMSPDGDFVISWSSSSNDSNDIIYAQRYNAQGIPQGPEFRVCTDTGWSKRSDVAMAADGSFIVTWNGSGPGDPQGIYARRYAANGTAQDDVFRVNTYTNSVQYFPTVASSSDGDFVITWSGAGQDDPDGIYAQRYNAQGTAQGTEFQVNSYTTNHQNLPAIAMAENGDFAITWASNEQDGDQQGIYAQRYAANGITQGPEFQVNTETQGWQYRPAIAMAPAGHFVVTWSSQPPNSNRNLYAQRYDAQGQAQGGETQLNLARNGPFESPVAMNAQGDFVATWSGGSNIWARLFDSQGQPK